MIYLPSTLFGALLSLAAFSNALPSSSAGQNNGILRLPVTAQAVNVTDQLADFGRRDIVEVPLQNALTGTLYLIQVPLGSVPQSVPLAIDTSSGETFVNPVCSTSGNAAFCRSLPRFTSSATLVDLGVQGDADFGTSSASFQYVADSVRFGTFTISQQIFGAIFSSTNLVAGVLGLGGDIDNPYPFVIDSLKSQGVTPSRAFSLDLRSVDSPDGAVIFGGIDTKKYIGALEKRPMIPVAQTPTPNSSGRYWIYINSIGITKPGSTPKLYPATGTAQGQPAFINSRATISRLPTTLVNIIVADFPGATQDASGLYVVDCAVGSQAGTVDFGFGNTIIHVSFKDFLWQNGGICYLGVTADDIAPQLGDSFLRAAFVVFDLDNRNVHLANAANCGTNLAAITTGPNAVPSIVGGCAAPISTTSSASPTSPASSSSSDMPSTTSATSTTSTTTPSDTSTTSSTTSSDTSTTSSTTSSATSSDTPSTTPSTTFSTSSSDTPSTTPSTTFDTSSTVSSTISKTTSSSTSSSSSSSVSGSSSGTSTATPVGSTISTVTTSISSASLPSSISTSTLGVISSTSSSAVNSPFSTSSVVSTSIVDPTSTHIPSGPGSNSTTATTVISSSSTSSLHQSTTIYTISTVYTTSIYTITSCAARITNCPAIVGQVTTEVISLYTTVCPVTIATSTIKPVPTSTPTPSATEYTISTVYATKTYTITSCAPKVTDCPASIGKVTTEMVALYTTYCPVTKGEVSGSITNIAIESQIPATTATKTNSAIGVTNSAIGVATIVSVSIAPLNVLPSQGATGNSTVKVAASSIPTSILITNSAPTAFGAENLKFGSIILIAFIAYL